MSLQGNKSEIKTSTVEMIAKRFLDDKRGHFMIGVSLTDEAISRVLRESEKKLTITSFQEDYTHFLHQYGSIGGESFHMCGFGAGQIEGQISNMVAEQNSFQCNFQFEIPPREMEFCWFIGWINSWEHFYLNLFPGNGHVFAINFDERNTKFFADNFSTFFQNFYCCYNNAKIINPQYSELSFVDMTDLTQVYLMENESEGILSENNEETTLDKAENEMKPEKDGEAKKDTESAGSGYAPTDIVQDSPGKESSNVAVMSDVQSPSTQALPVNEDSNGTVETAQSPTAVEAKIKTPSTEVPKSPAEDKKKVIVNDTKSESVSDEPKTVTSPVVIEKSVSSPVAEGSVSAPVTEELQVVSPVAEEPKVASPVAEEPKVVSPVADVLKVASPVAEKPKVAVEVLRSASSPLAEESNPASSPVVEESKPVSTPEIQSIPSPTSEVPLEQPEVPSETAAVSSNDNVVSTEKIEAAPLAEELSSEVKVESPLQEKVPSPVKETKNGGNQVAVSGDFNQWEDKCILNKMDGVSSTKLKRSKVTHHLKFLVDRNWTVDESQEETRRRLHEFEEKMKNQRELIEKEVQELVRQLGEEMKNIFLQAAWKSLPDQVPVEPPANSPFPISHIRVRLPTGVTITRRFKSDTPLSMLLSYIASQGYPTGEYKVLASWPRRDLVTLESHKTLEELKLYPKEVVTLEKR